MTTLETLSSELKPSTGVNEIEFLMSYSFIWISKTFLKILIQNQKNILSEQSVFKITLVYIKAKNFNTLCPAQATSAL